MKITYLKLVNFSNIKTALKCNEITIDFSKAKNKIILLTGPNGSGKTSILSCLHPFATNGNLDIRSENPIILTGKEGFKEIHLIGDDEYVIKHFYFPNKDTHSIKSYISKNGEELNENGNVTSFKAIVKEELNLDMDYLKLIRLGDNVTNLIDLKTTERKGYMGKFLDEVEIYLKYYKKITNNMRELKSVISHLVDKIQKLNILDEDELKKVQKKLSKQIEDISSTISVISEDISIINYEISKYEPPIIIKEAIDMKKRELNKIYHLLEKHNAQNTSNIEIQNIISKTSENLVKNQANLSILNDKLTTILNQLDKQILELNNIDKEISKISNNEDIKNIEFMIKQLREKIEYRSRENDLIDYTPPCTKKEMEELIVALDKYNEILYTTYEFGKSSISKAIDFLINGHDISEYVESNERKVNKNKLQSMCEYVYSELTKKIGIPNPKCKMANNCPVMDFYNEISDLATEVPDVVIEDNTFIQYTKMAYQNIKGILNSMRDHKAILEKMPDNIQDMFRYNIILNEIKNLSSIYDKEVMYCEMTRITEYELQQNDLNTLTDLKRQLSLIKKSIGNTDYFIKKKEELISDITDNNNQAASLREDIYKTDSKISKLSNDLNEYTQLLKSIETKDSAESDLNNLIESYECIKNLSIQKKDKSEVLDGLMYELKKIQTEYNSNEYRLKSYKEMNDELSSYNTKYDEMTLIKRSLSSKEGIPLLYIQIYLKNTQNIANELLDIIYDGELFINDFNISADEFKIPFTTKNTTIKDVSYASQGEKSFISVALSFALIYQSISQYNIMLLDEIDSTLDTTNREKFIQILERQLDMISGDQIFLISHNNMFNMYPVDIINTKNETNSENKLANYIKIEKN